MLFIYIFIILLAAFPLLLTAWRMRKEARLKKTGVYTNGVITHINTIRTRPGGTLDILTIEYKDRLTGQPYNATATVTYQKFKVGDIMEVIYMPDKPSTYAIDTQKGYLIILIFCSILFLFVIFAVYKINELAQFK